MMMDDATDYANVEAWIARGRMREMMAKGWRALGPIRDDAVLMSGPDPDLCPDLEVRSPVSLGRVAMGLAAVRRARATHGHGLERLGAGRPGADGRHVA